VAALQSPVTPYTIGLELELLVTVSCAAAYIWPTCGLWHRPIPKRETDESDMTECIGQQGALGQ